MRFSTSWDRVSVLQCLTLSCQNVALFSCLNHLLTKEDGLEDFIATVINHAIVPFGCRSRLPPFRQQHAITRQHWGVIMQLLAHLIVFEFWRNHTKTHIARGKKQNISKCNHRVSENVRCRLWLRSEQSWVEVQWVLTSVHEGNDSTQGT